MAGFLDFYYIGGVRHLTPRISANPRLIPQAWNLAELGGIRRNLAEFGGIWRKLAELGGNCGIGGVKCRTPPLQTEKTENTTGLFILNFLWPFYRNFLLRP